MARLPWITASEDFYPRPPRGGRRPWRKSNRTRFRISIHALREEGDDTLSTVHDAIVISIHALREEGDSVCQVNCTIFVISIHALREEGDHHIPIHTFRCQVISIHALREEGDVICSASR